MTLRRAVAAPFAQRGKDRLAESAFVVAVSLDRDWFSPDQATGLVDVAVSEGLLEREADDLVTTFDPASVTVPPDFEPDEAVIQRRSTFEQVLDRCLDAGVEKQTVVAEINALQAELGVTVEAAAVVYATRQGIDVADVAERAREDLRAEGEDA
jgi:hypothetical protein